MKATIQNKDNQFTTLVLENQEAITVPNHALPNDAKMGETIILAFLKENAQEQTELARTMINVLLTPN